MNKPTNNFKQGDSVRLITTNHTYDVWFVFRNLNTPSLGGLVDLYVKRYHPKNVNRSLRHSTSEVICFMLDSGHDTRDDLAVRRDLQWKIKLIYENFFLISSNQNHLLICNKDALAK